MRHASIILACIVIGGGLAPSALAELAPLLVAPVHMELVDGTFHLMAPLRIGPGESLALRNATVYLDYRDATGTPAIDVAGGTLVILGSTLATHLVEGFIISGESARVTILGSDVSNYSSIQFSYPGIASALLADSTFHDAKGKLAFTRGATVTATGNEFRDSPSGLNVIDAQATIVGNHFARITSGRAIDVQATIVGERAFPMRTVVENNLFEGDHWAALVMSGDPITVRGNVVRANHFGVTVTPYFGETTPRMTAPTIEGNMFDGNDHGLTLSLNGVLVQPSSFAAAIHGNSFVNNTCYDLRVYDRADGTVFSIDATQNWWGSAAGPQTKGPTCPGVSGATVTTAPWMTTAR